MIPLILHQCFSRVTWKYPFWTFAWYHIITCSKRNLNFLASLCSWVDWFGYTQRRLGYSRLRSFDVNSTTAFSFFDGYAQKRLGHSRPSSFDVNSKTAFSLSDLISTCRDRPCPFWFATRQGPPSLHSYRDNCPTSQEWLWRHVCLQYY